MSERIEMRKRHGRRLYPETGIPTPYCECNALWWECDAARLLDALDRADAIIEDQRIRLDDRAERLDGAEAELGVAKDALGLKQRAITEVQRQRDDALEALRKVEDVLRLPGPSHRFGPERARRIARQTRERIERSE